MTLAVFLSALLTSVNVASAATITQPSGVVVTVEQDGSYSIQTTNPRWIFSGRVGGGARSLRVGAGRDEIGPYSDISFRFAKRGLRRGAIRAYAYKPVVLFESGYDAGSPNSAPFPQFEKYPQGLFHLSFHWTFSRPAFDLEGKDSPWIFFDDQSRAFILSPASQFIVATTTITSSGAIATGIIPGIKDLPAGFVHKTVLVFGSGINSAYEDWGNVLTAIYKKKRPANDSEVALRRLAYWTDNGAVYYYRFLSSTTAAGTLLAVKDEFMKRGFPLGYMQLDSWWYLKGNPPSWKNGGQGIHTYDADPELFPEGLAAFQSKLGLPLITHARWIDASSPYRQRYTISHNVATDPRYWADLAAFLKNRGATMYEQDWLDTGNDPTRVAAAEENLKDPDAFFDTMASAMAAKGITIQYCMPRPAHYLQSVKYSNVTNIRVNSDRFDRSEWDSFLYDSRLAGALGLWPWSDVFMSTETPELLLSTLSGGVVGIGDRIGLESIDNLKRAARLDGVIVKPDAPIVPMDDVYVADAKRSSSPMVAWTYSDHRGVRTAYVFTYPRTVSTDTVRASFSSAALGVSGPAYVYNYFSKAGALLDSTGRFTDDADRDGSYYIVAPIGRSGIAFLGDLDQFVPLGKQRIAEWHDDGRISARVNFAEGENEVKLEGFAPAKPKATAPDGSVGAVEYDASRRIFSFSVRPGASKTASVVIRVD